MSQEDLPVEQIRPQFEQALEHNQALIISAPTGSGKSTRLPIWLATGQPRPVLVVEPRRVACRALADYISSVMGETVGQRVGYSVRFEERRSANTQVLFVTPGVALRLLARGQRFDFGAVMIDEFHERGWETDLLATLLRERLNTDPELRLIVTSATLDIEALKAQLGALHIEATGRTYPVTAQYMPEGTHAPSHDRLDERVARAVRQIVEREDLDGEILVFLPGKGELRDAQQQLEGLAQRHGLSLVQIHASLPMSQLARAYAPPVAGQRRVFLSTNVAETSLTLPGVTWVVDSGLARMVIHRGGKTALAMVPISQDAMDQRMGRAGRVSAGRCIRLWDERYRPQAVTAPELERMELDDVLLRAAICGLDGERLERAPWITPPPQFALKRASARLKNIGALDEQGRITPSGERLAHLPVSVDEARMLVDTPAPLKLLMPDLVAILQRGQRMILPLDKVHDAQGVLEARKALFLGCRHEVAEAIVALRQGDARRHGLHDAALSEARKLAHSLRQLIDPDAPAPTSTHEPSIPFEALIKHLLERSPESAFVLRERALKREQQAKPQRSKSQPWANGQIEVMVDPFTPYNDEDKLKPHERPLAGLLLNTMWLGAREGLSVIARGSMLLPCSLKQLAQADLGEQIVSEVTLQGSKHSPRVVGTVRQELAGVALDTTQRALRGEPLARASASLIMQNRLFKGALEPLLDRLHLWSILHQWMPTLETEHWRLDKLQNEPAPPEPEDYLTQRLLEMGVQTNEDLSLIGPEDLLPDLASRVNAADYELEQLMEELPRIWEFQGARYTCTPSIRAARITLEPENHIARKNSEPSAKFLPRFRGFRVVYVQASRSVTLRG